MNLMWHSGKRAKETHCHLSCLPKDGKMFYGKGVSQQYLPFARLSSQPPGKQKKQLLKHWEGLLSCEDLPRPLISFHALAASTLHSVISLIGQVHRHTYIPLSTHLWAKCNYSTLQGCIYIPIASRMLMMFLIDHTSTLTLASNPWHQKSWPSICVFGGADCETLNNWKSFHSL